MTTAYYQNDTVDDYEALPLDTLETATPIPLTRIGTTNWYEFEADSSLEYTIRDSSGFDRGAIAASPGITGGYTPSQIADEIESTGRILPTLAAIFDGIDKIAKWLRR